MSTFKEIRGQLIKKYTTNPTDPLEGQMWYNNTTGTLKGMVLSEAWSSGSPLAQARGQLAMFGTQDAAVGAGGSGPGATMYNDTEEYNGTGWATGGDLNTTREGLVGAGIITAGVVAGGFIEPSTYSTAAEEYNGTAWTSVTVAPYAAQGMGSFGTQAAAVFAGGDPGSKNTALDYTSPGSWTAASGTLNTGRAQLGSAGQSPATAGAVFGGTPLVTSTEEYNGTAWAVGGVLPAGVQFGGGAGIQTAALSFGGMSAPTTMTTATNKYDGTSWTAAPTLGTAQGRSPGNGSQTAALLAGGDQPHATPVATTQEWNVSTNVITGATWAALPALGTARYGVGIGYVDNANALGGMSVPARSGVTENYDGSSWTASGSMGTARYRVTGGGTQTSGIGYGGYIPGSGLQTACEEYDGSTWTGGTALPTGAQFGAGNGPQTAAMYTGINEGPGDVSTTRLYDGGTWTTGGTLTSTRRQGTLIGNAATQTAALYVGGFPNQTTAESYNGSTWTASPAILVASHALANAGVQADALIFCGDGFTSNSSRWDGTGWITDASTTNARVVGAGGSAGGAATASNAMAIGGNPVSSLVEQYSGATTAANIVTVTTS